MSAPTVPTGRPTTCELMVIEDSRSFRSSTLSPIRSST
ncbi:hypothetical protein COLO4_01543 [Corchorus olitorius]|uniref:Uncharacterized protein n=1 Tax=Corchorus olitorius TaxID=93759 RepID=A0A1R3L2B7_9ROSI|nr:hypothetical protein COLO4_01543 [Corchorus olitorius]